MKALEVINKLKESGELNILYANGMVPYKPFLYSDICNKVNALILSGMSRPRAIRSISQQLSLSARTIHRALLLNH